MKKIIVLLLCVALCASFLCACKDKTDSKELFPMYTVPEEKEEDNLYTVLGKWELNDELTCLEFTAEIGIWFNWSMATHISMQYIDDAKNPRYELAMDAHTSHKRLLCTITKDGTQWKDGAIRTLDFGERNMQVAWDFYSWLQANAKPVTD